MNAKVALAVRVLAAATLLLRDGLSIAATAGAAFSVTVTVLATREQNLRDAQITVQAGDGKVHVLDALQKAQFIRSPASIERQLRTEPGRPVLITVYY